MAWKGWEFFVHEPYEFDTLRCKVCNGILDVQRNVPYRGKFSTFDRPKDIFTCPHSDELWHKQVLALRKEIKRTPSARIATIMREEICEIMECRKETKEVSDFDF